VTTTFSNSGTWLRNEAYESWYRRRIWDVN
jgi:hypothetical protein